MHSTEAISAPDCPFRGTVWPQFSRKRHPESGNRVFHPRISNLAPNPCPEMALFSNDTGQFSGLHRLVDGWGAPQENAGWVTRDLEAGEEI